MIVAYPTKWTPKLPALPGATTDTSGVQQVVINIGDNNFGKNFPKEHVEFIDRLKNCGKRTVEDDEKYRENGDVTLFILVQQVLLALQANPILSCCSIAALTSFFWMIL